MAVLLEARNVRKVFARGGGLFRKKGETVALDNFSLAIPDEPPTFTTVAGESGSGKTTLANLLLGFLTPTGGQVLYGGRDLWQMSREEWRVFRKEVQAVFQDPFEIYNPFYKVDHILATPVAKFHLARSKADAHDLMAEALRGVGLRPEETLGRYPHQLSGGQRQRVTIARALLLRPRLIIADEPVSMIDASLRATILESLRRLNQDLGISFLYITHDLTTAYQMSENIVVLYQGTVAEAGDVDQVIRDPKHPYTQELITSIPWPDPDRRWGRKKVSQEETPTPEAGANGPFTGARAGCKYAERCPFVMPVCRESHPPLFRSDDHRAVACYLYQGTPIVSGENLAQVFSTRQQTASGSNGQGRG